MRLLAGPTKPVGADPTAGLEDLEACRAARAHDVEEPWRAWHETFR